MMPMIFGTPGATLVDSLRPGGSEAIVSNSLASPTVVTTLAPHGLVTGDQIYWTASTTSVPLLTATPLTTVTVLTATTFSLDGINCSTAGTAGAYAHAVLTIPTTPAAAPLVTCGRPHGLRVGDTVTFVGGNATPDLDGVQTVTAIESATAFRVLTSANPTTVAATVPGYFTKTTFYSDVFTRLGAGPAGITLTSVIGTAPVTTLVDMEASIDGVNWFNCIYTARTTPQTAIAGTQLTITTATTSIYFFPTAMAPASGGQVWRFFRLKFASSTNILLTANIYTAKINAF
jgi:hypothetical protein